MPKPKTYKWTGWVTSDCSEYFVENVRTGLWTAYPDSDGINCAFLDLADEVSRLRGDLLEEDRKTARKVTITVTIE